MATTLSTLCQEESSAVERCAEVMENRGRAICSPPYLIQYILHQLASDSKISLRKPETGASVATFPAYPTDSKSPMSECCSVASLSGGLHIHSPHQILADAPEKPHKQGVKETLFPHSFHWATGIHHRCMFKGCLLLLLLC